MRSKNRHPFTKTILMLSLFSMMFTLTTLTTHTQINVGKNTTRLSPTKPPW